MMFQDQVKYGQECAEKEGFDPDNAWKIAHRRGQW